MMSLDKNLWREAIAHYQAWNDAVFADQVLHPSQKTPAEKWRIYQDLYAFGRKIKPQPSLWEQEQTAKTWAAYYESIQQFEQWRKEHGGTA